MFALRSLVLSLFLSSYCWAYTIDDIPGWGRGSTLAELALYDGRAKDLRVVENPGSTNQQFFFARDVYIADIINAIEERKYYAYLSGFTNITELYVGLHPTNDIMRSAGGATRSDPQIIERFKSELRQLAEAYINLEAYEKGVYYVDGEAIGNWYDPDEPVSQDGEFVGWYAQWDIEDEPYISLETNIAALAYVTHVHRLPKWMEDFDFDDYVEGTNNVPNPVNKYESGVETLLRYAGLPENFFDYHPSRWLYQFEPYGITNEFTEAGGLLWSRGGVSDLRTEPWSTLDYGIDGIMRLLDMLVMLPFQEDDAYPTRHITTERWVDADCVVWRNDDNDPAGSPDVRDDLEDMVCDRDALQRDEDADLFTLNNSAEVSWLVEWLWIRDTIYLNLEIDTQTSEGEIYIAVAGAEGVETRASWFWAVPIQNTLAGQFWTDLLREDGRGGRLVIYDCELILVSSSGFDTNTCEVLPEAFIKTPYGVSVNVAAPFEEEDENVAKAVYRLSDDEEFLVDYAYEDFLNCCPKINRNSRTFFEFTFLPFGLAENFPGSAIESLEGCITSPFQDLIDEMSSTDAWTSYGDFGSGNFGGGALEVTLTGSPHAYFFPSFVYDITPSKLGQIEGVE